MIHPSLEAATNAYTRHERERRWTLTAVAIKEFHVQQQRWPRSLNELTTVGLSVSDWMATNSTPFGYQISADSDEAILWTAHVEAVFWTASSGGAVVDETMSLVPPSIYLIDPVKLEEMEVRIAK